MPEFTDLTNIYLFFFDGPEFFEVRMVERLFETVLIDVPVALLLGGAVFDITKLIYPNFAVEAGIIEL